MNAGCYGTEMSDILIKVKVIDRLKGVKEISAKDLKLKYRESNLSNDLIIVSAYLMADKNTKYNENIVKDIRGQRIKSQPVGQLTGGSTFKNPPGYKVWELIDNAGCRGLSIGGAKISEMHTNFAFYQDIFNFNLDS